MRKIFTSLILVSVLAVPVVGLAQMGINEAATGCEIKHSLSDYSTCCITDPDGTMWCMGPGDKTADFEYTYGKTFTHCCLVDKILTIGDWLFTAILVVAIIIILIAAFQFLTSSGDPDKIKSARNYLIYALIGVAVAFLAKVLVRVVASIMT